MESEFVKIHLENYPSFHPIREIREDGTVDANLIKIVSYSTSPLHSPPGRQRKICVEGCRRVMVHLLGGAMTAELLGVPTLKREEFSGVWVEHPTSLATHFFD